MEKHIIHTGKTQNNRVVERQPKTVEATPAVKKILKSIKNIKEDIKNLQYEEGQFKKDLDAAVGNTETILDDKGHVLATWGYNDTHRFDMERFKEDHKDLYTQYLDASRQRRLIIKK